MATLVTPQNRRHKTLQPHRAKPPALSPKQALLKRLGATLRQPINAALQHINWGTLSVYTPDGKHFRAGSGATNEPAATVHIHDDRFYALLALEKDIGAGRAYANGYWTSSDLYEALRIFLHNEDALNRLQGQFSWATSGLYRLLHKLNANSQSQAKDNISAHYDLGNDFFSAWLDPRMMYSSAVYSDENTSLEAAQLEKIDRICRKLRLKPGQTVLEIGTGWGGFAIHAARKYGVHVTTTTISKEQHSYAEQAVKDAKLEDKITLLLQDYRELEGQFDAVVSIEMVEAVGYEYFDTYTSTISRCLKPEGQALIQAITIPDHRFDDYKRDTDFIKHFIFPGGCLPSVSALLESFAKPGGMRSYHMEDFGQHYATTLLEWNRRFKDKLPSMKQRYQSPWFARIWEFYLVVCAALFTEHKCGLVQLHLVKPDARPEPLLMEQLPA